MTCFIVEYVTNTQRDLRIISYPEVSLFIGVFFYAGGMIAPLGQTSAHEPHSMHVSGSM